MHSDNLEIIRNSVILLDKPCGITSSGALNRVKKLTGVKKAGHSGTLDKFASGLLVVCTGFVTKLTRFFLESDKRYTGKIRFGITTDTLDPEGEIIDSKAVDNLTLDTVTGLLEKYTGEITQLPPVYSSLKISGKRASDLAREGKDVSLKKRQVTVKGIDLLEYNPEESSITLDIRCSKGTYIRSLARDMGNDLGCGAYLESLRRTESGRFSLESAVTIEEIESFSKGGIIDKEFIIRPPDALADFSRIIVNENGRRRAINGANFDYSDVIDMNENDNSLYIIEDDKRNLIGIAEINTEKWNIKYLNIFHQVD
jgi:tRNA pseudouridine55 synthase